MFVWQELFFIIFITTIFTMVIYFGACSYYYHKYYIRLRDQYREWKCQPDRWLTPEKLRFAMVLSTKVIVLIGFISGTYWYLIYLGHTKIYFDFRYSLVYSLLSGVVFWVWIEAIAYYLHRCFHIRWFFRRFHKYHHRCFATTPFVTLAIHPVEYFPLNVMTLLPGLFVPIDGYMFILVLIYSFPPKTFSP